ncbi:peptidoglycan-binding protein [Luteimonas sp. WGS1318]|uniref:peptidoglycan-binding protein n=1 Tax=Luteimonas sp. WGS1318 TaxID=3366815 RepID=UPI00372D13B0
MPTIHTNMIQPKGAAYRTSQLHNRSHYLDPIEELEGRLSGNSRIWGDASPEVQSRVIDILINASKDAGLNVRETAHVLAIARTESGFNPDAAAGTTSASGLGQFIDDTGKAFGLNDRNRFDAESQAQALVTHFIENRELATRRGQGEAYIYKYHHDGPMRDYGGLAHAEKKVLPMLDSYARFVEQQLRAGRVDPQPDTLRNHAGRTADAPVLSLAAQRTPGRPLRDGDQGPDVRTLQTTLTALGFDDARGRALDDDGRFGTRTGEAVRAFQQAHGLDVDGIVGVETRRALEAATRAAPAAPAASAPPAPVADPVQIAPLDRLFAAARGDDSATFRTALADFTETPFGRRFQATLAEQAVEPDRAMQTGALDPDAAQR